MIAVNCTEDHLQQALDIINVNYLGNIALTDLEQTVEGIQFNLCVKDRKGPGVLLDSKRRRTTSTCWHAVGHFIDELFEVAEEAEVYSDLTGKWITKAGGNRQDKNIGTEDRPLLLSRACDCNRRAQKAIERLIPGPVMFRTGNEIPDKAEEEITMKKPNITPAEMVKIFQEGNPHIDVRLSRPGDPELSSVFINFYSEPMRSKALMQQKSADMKTKGNTRRKK